MADGDLQIQTALGLFDQAKEQLAKRLELTGDARVAEKVDDPEPAAADGGV
jgi:hypothetical protein